MVQNGPIEPRDHRRRGLLGRLLHRPGNRRVRSVPRPVPGAVPTVERGDEPTVRVRDRRRRLRLVLAALAAVALAGGLATGAWFGHRALTRSPHFAIRAIRVSPTRHLTAEAVRARAGLELGANLFTVDLAAAAADLRGEPWIAEARVRRELPSTIAIDVREREPSCAIAFTGLYLADARGEAFKRASPEEAVGLPVITGVPRDLYVDDREGAQGLIREGLRALAVYREAPTRPAIGEVHVDAALGVTLFTVEHGVGIRLGRGDGAEGEAAWRRRLEAYDAVARALADSGERAQLVLVDQVAHPDRVTVRLAGK